MRPRGSIFRRYAFVVSVALAGTLLVASLVEIAFSLGENLRRTEEFHVSEARAASRRVEVFFGEIERNFLAIASSPWNRGLDGSDRLREYQRVMRLLPAVRDVTFAGPDGREALFVSRTDPNRQGSGRPVDPVLFGQGRSQGAVFGEVEHGRESRAPFVRLALRDRGDSAGVAIVTVNLQFISDELARMARRGTEVAYVLDPQGRVVAHVDVSRSLQASRPDRDNPVLKAPVAQGSFWIRDAGGSPVLAVFNRLRNPPWTIVVESPWRQVLEPVLATLYRALALVAVAVLLSLLIARWLANRMARPVVALRDGVAAYRAGNLDHRVELRTGDELEELAEEFNRVARQLAEYTGGLERKVDEKTAELQAALQVARDAMRSRALFLAAASHDLRQPLYAISILADTLSSERLQPGAAIVLEKQRHAIAVLRTLFDNLLDLSRFDAGEIRPSLRVVSIREILAACILEQEVVCHAKGLKFVCEIDPAWVRTDPELVRRVAGNLLSNAVRYTPSGTVTLAARGEGGHVRVTVADEGIGIAPADQARIFEEFVQLSNPARERDKGVGLGLSIVRRIAMLLDMNLRLESEPGRGTAVTFEVPAAANVHGVVAEEDLSFAAGGAFKGARIWIVEDDPMVRDALSMQFNAWEALPAFASSASELLALREAHGRWPDAIILDDMLGTGEQGLEIARMLREYVDDERIVLVTGNVDPARTLELEASGLVVLRKPLASSDLAQWLRQALRPAAEEATTSPARAPAG